MNMHKMTAKAAALLGLAAAVIAPASAQTPPVPTTAPTGAPVVSASGNIALTNTSPASGPIGTWTEAVYNNAPGNTFGSGALTFVFTVTQTTGPSAPGPGFSSFDFGILAPNIASVLGYDPTGSSAPPVIDAGRSGSTVNYATSFTTNGGVTIGSPMSAGQTTGSFVIYTNARNLMAAATANANNSGQHQFVSSSGTTPIIYGATLAPEPSTVAAFGIVGLGVCALAFRARRGKSQLAM